MQSTVHAGVGWSCCTDQWEIEAGETETNGDNLTSVIM